MDTYNIIKQLTAKTDMVSGQAIKDNFKSLLPVVAVHKGWGLYGGIVNFDFKPHPDYPHKKPYEIETDVYNEAERVANVEALNKDIDKYNDWADEQNDLHRSELIKKTIPDGKVRDVKDLNLKTQSYFPLPTLSAWMSWFQFDAPHWRVMSEAVSFGFVDDKELYKLKESMKEEIFVKRFNVHLFNYIQEQVKWQKEKEAFDELSLWYEPNREFVQWFQLRGINPDEVPSFDNDIIDLTYDEACEEAFDYKDWDTSLVQIVQEMRDVIIANEELFMVSGELQFKKGYEIGCRYWTQHGRPITVKQMITASTRYPKNEEDLV